MRASTQTLAAALLAAAAIAIGGGAVVQTGLLASNPLAALALGPVAAVGYTARGELREHVFGEPALALTRTDLGFVLAILVAAPLTRLLAVHAGLGVVFASGLVGLLAHVAVPKYEAPAYCGTFVGMASSSIFPLYALVAASLVAGVVFVGAQRVFNGFGGKLGTTAFVGCGVVALVMGTTGTETAVPSLISTAEFVVSGAVGAVAAYELARWRDLGPVFGSGLVGVIAGAALFVVPEASRLAAVVFCGSFTGMSHSRRVATTTGVAVAGVATGLVFSLAVSQFGGFGGKLGTIAFVSCLVVHLLSSLVRSD